MHSQHHSVTPHAEPAPFPCLCCGCTAERPCAPAACHVVLLMPTEGILLCSRCWTAEGRRLCLEALATLKATYTPASVKEVAHA